MCEKKHVCRNSEQMFDSRSWNVLLLLSTAFILCLLNRPVPAQNGDNLVTWQGNVNKKAVHEDYPWIDVDGNGTPWMVFVEHAGEKDVLKLARRTDGSMEVKAKLAGPGMIHRPRLIHAGEGTLWAIWSQRNLLHRWELKARKITGGTPEQDTLNAGTSSSNQIFPDTAVGPDGRLWIVWQAMSANGRRIHLMWYKAGSNQRSNVITVNNGSEASSGWRPRVATGSDGNARIVYERAEEGEFDLMMATVGKDGTVNRKPLADTPSHEAFAEIAAGPDGKTFYVTWERGKKNWGHDSRSHKFSVGINSWKGIEVASFGTESGNVESLPPVRPLIVNMIDGIENVVSTNLAVNEPQIAVDGSGRPWVFVRWAVNNVSGVKNRVWQIAACRYDPDRQQWSNPFKLSPSSLGQDRLCSVVRGGNNDFFVSWPSDHRPNPAGTKNTGAFLARINTEANLSVPDQVPERPEENQDPPHTKPAQISNDTGSDPFQVSHRGNTYALYWGDTHRHTDLSPDRTIWDGTATEHFRYAYEVGRLDFLATSDHTDIGPRQYQPYEWWQTQKISDYMTTPDHFLGFYGYEREQGYPWGHRNVVFGEIGGPIVYISRNRYQNSPWQEPYPVSDGGGQITPDELWKILRKAGKPVAVISHTPATKGMGTNWKKYDRIDQRVENTVELYQGARISYEAIGAPQPTVGMDTEKSPFQLKRTPNGRSMKSLHKLGTYQTALREGHRLGVVASSDHISTHTSFAGVYADRFTRTGILEAIKNRHTIAATDQIFLHYTCNGHLMGEEFRTDRNPELQIQLEGTAPIERVTVIRNEENYMAFEPDGDTSQFETTFRDSEPIEGENRYYVRVVQKDGNMAWASPVWVQYRP